MVVNVNVKQLGKRRNAVKETPFEFEIEPKTVRELIEETVRICLKSYKKRVEEIGDYKPLEKEEMQDMSEVGKIAFGIFGGGEAPSEKKAVETAITAFEDGLYRIFLNEEELEELEQEVRLTQKASLTFVRLTMLSGRLW